MGRWIFLRWARKGETRGAERAGKPQRALRGKGQRNGDSSAPCGGVGSSALRAYIARFFCAAARGLGERQGDAVPLRPSGRNLRFLHLPPGASAPCGGVSSFALCANIARLFVRCGTRGGETSGGRRPPKTLWQEPEVPAPSGFLPLLFPYFVTSMPRARSASGIVTPSFAATSGL